MKRLSIISLLFIAMTAFSGNSVSLKKDKVDEAKNIIDNTYKYIDKSNLPHQEVIQIEQALKTAYIDLSDTTK